MSARTLLALLFILVAVPAAPAGAVNRRAFATSVIGTGNISTWAGATGATVLDKADSVCRLRAAAAALPNAATYRAWISTSVTDAYCHVQGHTGKKATGCGGGTLPGGGPWFLANGITPFTATLDELVDAPFAIYRPVVLDENNAEIVEGALLTGTFFTGGVVPGRTCLDWTSSSAAELVSAGNSSASAYQWSGNSLVACDQALHLLCLEPGAGDPAGVSWLPGALAFVTSAVGNGNLASWPAADGLSGLAGGDRVCRNLAAAAHLPAPGSFVAWLGANPVNAADRISTNGPFRRVDGFPIAFSLVDLIDGVASNSLHVDEQGAYLTEKGETWTGVNALGLWVSATCSGWTSDNSGIVGREGWADRARTGFWTDAFEQTCDSPLHLYCFANAVTLFWDGFELTGDASRWSTVVGAAP